VRSDSAAAPPPAAEPNNTLPRGLTRAQVEASFGPPLDSHEQVQDGLTTMTCTYQNANETVKAQFVNGVLVDYNIASR
jgi:hypothetical protein